MEACRFGTDSSFALPQSLQDLTGDTIDDLSGDSAGGCVEGERSFATRDMDGDLRPDLVIADDCDVAGVGTAEWLVHLNTGDGFADVPISWAIPSEFATDQLDDLSDDSGDSCVLGELSFDVRDMDGDGLPDLVVADNCDDGGIGSTHWLVYPNLGAGFASLAFDWSLPAGYGVDEIDDLSKDSGGSCVVGELSFVTRDMNGDRRPELVVTDRCDTGGVGTDHWLVYENLGDGFASTPTLWTIPAAFPTDGFDDASAEDSGTCAVGQLTFAMRDMDGDQAPDLVVTDNCDEGDVGASHWLVYLNQGDRFADNAIEWAVQAHSFDRYDKLADDVACVTGELSYTVVDADGDSAADLLVTDECDNQGVGSSHWLFMRADLTGFAEVASWTLPGFGTDRVDDVVQDDAGTCVEGEFSSAAIDLDGDRVLDLVVADNCDIAGVGATRWRVFHGSCD